MKRLFHARRAAPAECFTPDFFPMIRIVIWNSLGFFYVEFLLSYLTSQDLQGTGTQLGVTFALLFVGIMASSSFVGFLTDRVSKRLLVMVGAIGRGTAYLVIYASAIAGSIGGMSAGALTLGFGAGFFWVPLDALIAEKSSKYHRSYAFGKRREAMGIGMVVGTFVGYLSFSLGTTYYPSNPYLVYMALPAFAAANVYAGLNFWRHVDEGLQFTDPPDPGSDHDPGPAANPGIKPGATPGATPEATPEATPGATPEATPGASPKLEPPSAPHPSTEGSTPATPTVPRGLLVGLVLVLVAIFMGSTNDQLAKPFLVPYILENVHADPALVVWLNFPITVVGSFVAPRLGTRTDRLNPYLGLTLSALAGGVVTWLVVLATNVWVVVVLLVLDNTLALLTGLILVNYLSRASVGHRGKVLGFRSFFEHLGAAVGPLLGGLAWDLVGHAAPFYLSIVVEWAIIPVVVWGVHVLQPNVAERVRREPAGKQEREK